MTLCSKPTSHYSSARALLESVDKNRDGIISKLEEIGAVMEYLQGQLTKDEIFFVMQCVRDYGGNIATMCQQEESAPSESTSCSGELLVLVSPQYGSDKAISDAVSSYSSSVKADLGWDVCVHRVSASENTITDIDTLIGEYDSRRELKACLMVGEDYKFEEMAGQVTQKTWGNRNNFGVPPRDIERLPIFFMVPPHNLPYDTRVVMLVRAFDKFNRTRGMYGDGLVSGMYLSGTHDLELMSVERLADFGEVLSSLCAYQTSRNDISVKQYLHSLYKENGIKLKLLEILGHGTADTILPVSTNDVLKIDVAILVLTCCGCADYQKDPITGLPIKQFWGRLVLDSDTLCVVSTGVYGSEFITTALPALKAGKTIAEALLDTFSDFRQVYYGDPAFHFDKRTGGE